MSTMNWTRKEFVLPDLSGNSTPVKVLFLLFFFCGFLAPCVSQIPGPYDRYNLQIRIVVKYPEQKLAANGASTDLTIVGNGLGLVWNVPTLLTKIDVDTWNIDLKFNGSMDGYGCDECTNNQRLPSGTNFEYRIMTGDGRDMIGPNFGMAIPMSKIESDFPIREYFCYPYFFTRRGSFNDINVTSADAFIGTRQWAYYFPPSFNENTHKKYPTIFVFDLGTVYMEMYQTLLEEILVEKAIAEEVVLIGMLDYGPDYQDRFEFLTPWPGIYYLCHDGEYPFVNNCNGCIPDDVVPYEREFFNLMRDKCGYALPHGGQGETFLDYMSDQVLPAVQQVSNSRLLTDQPNLGIGGCSLGGLMACYALWTRPETYGTAACTSSSFWWPNLPNADNGFYFLNITLKNNTFHRPPQKVYLDATDLEDGEYYAQVGAALTAVELMTSPSRQFRLDETIWFTLVNGQVHGVPECLTRSWIYLNLFFKPGGESKNPDPPFS